MRPALVLGTSRSMRIALAVIGAVCLLGGAAQGSTIKSGLYGKVTRGPITPVCIAEQPCSAPMPGAMIVFSRSGREVARHAHGGERDYRRGADTGHVQRSRAPGPTCRPGDRLRAAWPLPARRLLDRHRDQIARTPLGIAAPWRSFDAANGDQGRQDLNLQPPVLETGALPIELRPSVAQRLYRRSGSTIAPCRWWRSSPRSRLLLR